MLPLTTINLLLELLLKIHDDIPAEQRAQFWIDWKDLLDTVRRSTHAHMPSD